VVPCDSPVSSDDGQLFHVLGPWEHMLGLVATAPEFPFKADTESALVVYEAVGGGVGTYLLPPGRVCSLSCRNRAS
jgi:hypothetical protein